MSRAWQRARYIAMRLKTGSSTARSQDASNTAQSVLEKHKQAQVRPARFPLSDGGIIRSALSSGK